MLIDAVVQWLHVMSAIIWVGGTIFASLVLQPILAKNLPPQQRMPLYHLMGNRFKVIQTVCLLTLIATGSFKLWPFRHQPEAFASFYGHVLEIKLTLVALVTLLTYLHSYVWGPRLTALAQSPGSPEFAAVLRKLYVWGRINLVLIVAVVFCAALLRFGPF